MNPDEVAGEALRRGAVQKRDELAALLELLAEHTCAVAVEIGVYHGGTLWAWAEMVTDVAIGIDSGVGLEAWSEMRHPVTAELVAGDSHDAATLETLKRVLRGRPIDFLFIDGDHTYGGVRQDLLTFGPLVRPGGLIALHDILHHADPDMGVERLWSEIRDDASRELVAEPTWWGGIGVRPVR